MKYALVIAGLLLGGLFANEKFQAPHEVESKTEIIYGHRVGPTGEFIVLHSN